MWYNQGCLALEVQTLQRQASDACLIIAASQQSAWPQGCFTCRLCWRGFSIKKQQWREPPPGTLTVSLHAYQKRALAWMLYREEKAKGVRGGILAGMIAIDKCSFWKMAACISVLCLLSAAGVCLPDLDWVSVPPTMHPWSPGFCIPVSLPDQIC